MSCDSALHFEANVYDDPLEHLIAFASQMLEAEYAEYQRSGNANARCKAVAWRVLRDGLVLNGRRPGYVAALERRLGLQ